GPAAPLTREALDERVYYLLYPVMNEGADLYNTGSPNSCSFLFQGALMAVEPLLDHRPELQKAVRKGLADARQQTNPSRRAWAMREILDQVRSTVEPKMPLLAGGKTVWERLGGEKNVRKIVSEFIDA